MQISFHGDESIFGRRVRLARTLLDWGCATHCKETQMPKSWTDKDERKYEHIKKDQKESGKSAKRAKEIAARTVNRDRRDEGRTKKG
jgi:hypothetical protein